VKYYTSFTRYNRLSNRLYNRFRLHNRFDSRLYRVNKHPTACQTGGQTGLTTDLTTGCIHDTAGCQTGCQIPMGESGPPSNTWFIGPTRVLNPNGISISSAVFAGLTSVTDRPTDRPTDHATRSVTGRVYVCSTAMRHNNKWSR